jgi:hypothetical protein
VLDEVMLLEARTENYRRIADEATQARDVRLSSSSPEEKTNAIQTLKDLQKEFLGELNYGTRPEYMLRTNDEFEAIIHEISHQGPLDLSGLNHLKPSVIGDIEELAPRTQNNALSALFKSLKEKGKNIYQILATKQKTGKYG